MDAMQPNVREDHKRAVEEHEHMDGIRVFAHTSGGISDHVDIHINRRKVATLVGDVAERARRLLSVDDGAYDLMALV